ncbi:hypothetical protein GCM10023317_40390 [Actinopolymorpha pittospori]
MRTIAAAALLLALAVTMGAFFLDRANTFVTAAGDQGCPRTVLDEMFNLNEGAYHQGEPRSDAQISDQKKACLRAALPSMTVATTAMTGAVLLLLAAVELLTRESRGARWFLLAAMGFGTTVTLVVVTAA